MDHISVIRSWPSVPDNKQFFLIMILWKQNASVYNCLLFIMLSTYWQMMSIQWKSLLLSYNFYGRHKLHKIKICWRFLAKSTLSTFSPLSFRIVSIFYEGYYSICYLCIFPWMNTTPRTKGGSDLQHYINDIVMLCVEMTNFWGH